MAEVIAPEVSVNDLPQGKKFQYITEVTGFDNDESNRPLIRAVYCVYPRGDSWETDHFPGEVIFPGVLLGEVAAQAGILLIKHLGGEGSPRYAKLEIDFKGEVYLGDVLSVEVTLLNNRRNIYWFQFIIHKAGSGICVAKGTFTGIINP